MAELTDRERVKESFKVLRKAGYAARMGFMCCGTCASSKLSDKDEENVVYYSEQGNDSYNKDGKLIHTLYLSWSGDLQEIIGALVDSGLRVLHHTGNENRCVEVINAA